MNDGESSRTGPDSGAVEPQAGPGSVPGPHRVTDPMELRALAHPVRIRLLGLVAGQGTLTATQAAEMLGTTPASTAYHLRTLAKYGFVEDAEGGSWRERPWRATASGLSFSWNDDVADAGQRTVNRALSDVVYDMWLDQIQRYQATKDSYPAEIREISGGSEMTLYAAPEEIAQAQREIWAILDRFRGRAVNPELRPTGLPTMEMIIFTHPLSPPSPPPPLDPSQ